jgi:hypothetical protein
MSGIFLKAGYYRLKLDIVIMCAEEFYLLR